MRPLDCPKCFAAADRSGELVVQLQRAARQLHQALGHAPADWVRCHQAPCPDHLAVIKGTKELKRE